MQIRCVPTVIARQGSCSPYLFISCSFPHPHRHPHPQYTNFVADLIEEHPGTNAQALKVFEGTPTSWVQLNYQVEHIASTINDIVSASPDDFKDGYHLVCHSQGALICRCLTEYIDTHNIDTLVSMAGPQMGVYDEGETKPREERSVESSRRIRSPRFRYLTTN